MIQLLIILIILLIIDIPWISYFAANIYSKLVKSIQKSDITVRIGSAIFTYFLLALGIRFLVLNRVNSNKEAFIYGAIFGLISYGIFDFTNYAIFSNWTLMVSIIDMVWGGFLCAITSYLSYVVYNKIKN